MFKQITSLANDLVKHVVQLQLKPYRLANQEFIAQGTRTCQTLLASKKYALKHCLVTQDYEDLNSFPQDKIIQVSDDVMRKINPSTTPSGILCVFIVPKASILPKQGPGLICANMTDPGNVGTLLRTAAAMHIKNVIIVDGVDAYHPKVVQAAAGCHGLLDIHVASWQEIMQAKLPLAALVVEGGTPLPQVAYNKQFLVIGNEAHGLPQAWQDECQEKITIPMPGNTESLNAAIAGSIALYMLSSKHCN
jgi:TrmH family RNA methyltransferase